MKVFLKRGDIYSQTESNFETIPNLDDGIYRLLQNPLTGEIFLEKIGESFYFGFKLYGIDEVFVSHVLNTYNKQDTKRNIGILLNGAKGTGKTVTAKMLCNKLGLPVIIIDQPFGGLSNFLAGINHDCVFLFDEFEKNFRLKDEDGEQAGESLLSIMDGAYNSDNCHIFIMTTNELRVNGNLISRPSRIRYLKSFNDVIDKKILEEYVNDNLKYPKYKDEIIDFFESLTIGTIDILKSIVDEVNIHNCSVNEFKGFFNVKESVYYYNCKRVCFDNYDNKPLDINKILKKNNNKNKKNNIYDEEYEWYQAPLRLKKSIKCFKVGEFVDTVQKILLIDLNKQIFVSQDFRYPEKLTIWHIENIDIKPSLYDISYRNAYAYFDGE